MDNFKRASQLKLRFITNRGPLSVEQLWELSLTALASILKSLKKELKQTEDSDLDFLDDAKTVDTIGQLQFDILKDVYLTKKKENDDARNAVEKKAHNQKIMAIIQQKKEGQLNEKSIEELEALLKQ